MRSPGPRATAPLVRRSGRARHIRLRLQSSHSGRLIWLPTKGSTLRTARITLAPDVDGSAGGAAMAAEGTGTRELGQAEKLIAGGLIVVFLAAIVAMYLLRDDGHWDRLLFLFGALEALCFAGAGALFG